MEAAVAFPTVPFANAGSKFEKSTIVSSTV